MTSPSHAVPGLDTAVRRWKIGHQLFHLHLTAMNSLLEDATAALDSGRWAELAALFDELRMLYDAATATMRYAADFPKELYERIIRPSMAPPFTSPGFSGSLNTDHEQMLDRLRDLRRRVKPLRRRGGLPDAAHEAAGRLLAAQSRNRRHHVLVCTRFVPEGTSLLQAYFEATNPTTEAEQMTDHDDHERG
ncbi:hypothetical protein H4696_008929 [Amycolatopsis lexingtonensis]|uniref:Uncharacterized protein n=1 Tax=Amycolatopsis lexingtonensis TaxID=218822 RepID=A0ABR9IF74_9PSEU|nr:hypothetical protein [Amycolatopsis lexingtonensis]MBE1501829.1 hypothetical protein [Amycolatopsis lexingtonensis]